MPAECRIGRTTCWCPPGTFETLWSRRWWLSGKNSYRRWNLVPLPPAGNQETKRGMAPYLLAKTEKILHTTICRKGYADSLLGWTRGNFGALHAPGEHCDQCNVYRSKESSIACNQVQTTWTSEYRCFAPTWQCSAPYHLFNCCNNPRSVLCLPHPPYSPDFAPHRWLSCFWTAQRSDGRQFFQVWQRSVASKVRMATLSAKRIFLEVSMHFQSAGTLVWNTMETT